MWFSLILLFLSISIWVGSVQAYIVEKDPSKGLMLSLLCAVCSATAILYEKYRTKKFKEEKVKKKRTTVDELYGRENKR